jgi:hypothetical protein
MRLAGGDRVNAGVGYRRCNGPRDAGCYGGIEQESPLSPPAPTAASLFAEFLESPVMVAERTEREGRRSRERTRLLDAYGSVEAVFRQTEEENLLEAACRPLEVLGRWSDGSTYVESLAGWSIHSSSRNLPAAVVDAVCGAFPIPDGVEGLWDEYLGIEALVTARYHFQEDYDQPLWTQARCHVIEELLQTVPAVTKKDVEARLSYLRFVQDRSYRNLEENLALVDRLAADVASLMRD